MDLLKLINGSPMNSRLVFSDTKKQPKDKKVVKKMEIPIGINLDDFSRRHWPSKDEIPEGDYVIAAYKSYEMRYVNGTQERIEVPMLYYVAAKR